MRIKALPIPALRGTVQVRLQLLYTMLVKNYHRTKRVVNNNETMSCSRLRSFIGS